MNRILSDTAVRSITSHEKASTPRLKGCGPFVRGWVSWATTTPKPKRWSFSQTPCGSLLSCISFFFPTAHHCLIPVFIFSFLVFINLLPVCPLTAYYFIRAAEKQTQTWKSSAAGIRWGFRESRRRRVLPKLPGSFRCPSGKFIDHEWVLANVGLTHLGHLEMSEVQWTSGRGLVKGNSGLPCVVFHFVTK